MPRYWHRVARDCAGPISKLEPLDVPAQQSRPPIYEKQGFTLAKETDGSANEQKEPDAMLVVI
jgi:hypothetical protein